MGGGHGSGVKMSPTRHPELTKSYFPTRNCMRRDSPLKSTAADLAGGKSGPVCSPGTGGSRDPPGHAPPPPPGHHAHRGPADGPASPVL